MRRVPSVTTRQFRLVPIARDEVDMKIGKTVRKLHAWVDQHETEGELGRDAADAARASIREYERAHQCGDKAGENLALACFVKVFVRNARDL